MSIETKVQKNTVEIATPMTKAFTFTAVTPSNVYGVKYSITLLADERGIRYSAE